MSRLKMRLLALAGGALALLATQCGPAAPPVSTPTAPAPPVPTSPPVALPVPTSTSVAAPVPTPEPAAAGAAAATPAAGRPEAPRASPAPARPDYLGRVRAYADALLARGRDDEGRTRSPLFATALDRRTFDLLETVPPLPGMRPQDRVANAANPMHDENLYQVLYALTDVTGEQRYAAAADAALAWFFRRAQSPATGLLAWGEHLGWDLETEQRIVGAGGDDEDAEDLEGLYEHGTHEYFRPWVLWDRTFRLAPGAAERFALGVWEGHVGDHESGGYDRHAGYDRPQRSTGNEFPRHGGFYIATWAAAYEHSRDGTLLRAIATLVEYFESHRDEDTGMLVAMSSRPELGWPSQNLSLAIDLWDAARRLERLPLPAAARRLPERMRATAARNDATFLRLARSFPYSEHGFARAVRTDTLEPGDDRLKEGESLFTAPWSSAYGRESDAQVAMLCLLRYRQTGQRAYRGLFLEVADRYLTSDPDLSGVVYPGPVGIALGLELAAHRLTGERKYLERAHHFADLGLRLFLGSSPLPAASSRSTHYEALTRGDTLMMALLDLWFAVDRPGEVPPLIYSDR